MSQGNTSAAELAAQLVNNLQQIEKTQEPTAEVTIEIPAIRPGFRFRFVARRLDLLSFLYNGALPESLAAQMMVADRGGQERLAEMLSMAAEEREKMDGHEQAQLLRFQKMMALQVCVSPKLVDGPARNAGEVSLASLPYAGHIIVALYNYAMLLSPGVPVTLEGGKEADLDQVKGFRDGAELPNPGANGQERGDVDKQAATSGG